MNKAVSLLLALVFATGLSGCDMIRHEQWVRQQMAEYDKTRGPEPMYDEIRPRVAVLVREGKSQYDASMQAIEEYYGGGLSSRD